MVQYFWNTGQNNYRIFITDESWRYNSLQILLLQCYNIKMFLMVWAWPISFLYIYKTAETDGNSIMKNLRVATLYKWNRTWDVPRVSSQAEVYFNPISHTQWIKWLLSMIHPSFDESIIPTTINYAKWQLLKRFKNIYNFIMHWSYFLLSK